MSTNTIRTLKNRFVVRQATSESKEITANNAIDFDVPLSGFQSPGIPIGTLGWRFTGTGLSQLCVYYVIFDQTNNRVRIGARNRDSSAHTFFATVFMMFYE